MAQGAMGAVVVAVPLVLPKHGRGVSLVDDQDAVEQFAVACSMTKNAYSRCRVIVSR